jgi:signal transduction histidine kinase
MDDLPESSETWANLAKVVTAAKRGRDLIRQILAYSRQQPVRLEPISLQNIVNEAIDLLRATLPATTEIRSRFADDVDSVLADSTQIREVLINLGTNAAHAIGDRTGHLEIDLERVEFDSGSNLPLGGLTPGSYVRLTVSDTGCGMDEETIARIFDPYFTTKPAGEGSGLGLAAVQGIIASHHGAIEVSSAPGQGAAFMIYLPLLTEEYLPLV